ncbi:MAG TPA: TerB family tellurite resistance protein [Bacteroidales bacterium]|nr:TerB family tellurite resistance protein [Bacteroidales bacterium]
MGKFAKWLGGGLGFVTGGPIGGLLGFLVGSFIDEAQGHTYSSASTSQGTTPGAFGMSLLVLIAAVMKADGKVVKAELDYVKEFFVRQFGRETSREALIMLRDLLKQDIPLRDVCLQIGRNMDYASKLQLLNLLFGVSASDNRIVPEEVRVIETISNYLGISGTDYISIRNMFIPETDSAYKILEVDPSASNEEVKKAYRQMAMKYHPDKVSHLGEDFRRTADEKFKKVNEAYERIKKERNMV